MAASEKNGVTMLSIIAAAAESVSLELLRNEDAPIPFHSGNMISSTEESANPTDEDSSSGSASSVGGVERVSSSGESTSPSRSKLVLPDMTPDVRKDLESGRGSSSDLPLSISKRPEWADYRLKDIVHPHPNDVRKSVFFGSALNVNLLTQPINFVAFVPHNLQIYAFSLRSRRRFQQPPR